MTTATISPPQVETGPHPWTWTSEQYYKLGELGFFQAKRVELIHGEIIAMSPIGWPHALATGLVVDVLSRIFAGGHWINEQKPFSVPNSIPGSEPQPDVVIVPGTRRNYKDHPTVAALIVEVSDTTLFYDTTTKAELYATAGVPEYWVLDLDGKRLLVFRDPVQLPKGLGASAYQTHFSLGSTETIAPLAVPNSNITVSELLP
jgi:Uma2 family endonuclease